MASGNQGGGEGLGDDFFEQMLSVPVSSYSGGGRVEAVNYVGGGGSSGSDHDHHHGSMLLGLGPGDGSTHGLDAMGVGGGFREMGLPLGLNLDPTGSASSSFLKTEGVSCKPFGIVDGGEGVGGANLAPSPSSRIHGNDSMHLTSLFPAALGHMQQSQPLRPYHPPQVQLQQPFQGQAPPPSVPVSHPPPIRPKVRARRGQATDPHSIAERLRRERIAERLKALQELVPSCNKTDRAAMLDEIVDYVKFLKLQVKVLSMSRLGGGGAVAQLVADVPAPPSSMEGEEDSQRAAWERWTEDGTEEHVAKLMEEDIGSAMQFLQSKELCIMPISLASALFQAHPQDVASMVKPESDNPP